MPDGLQLFINAKYFYFSFSFSVQNAWLIILSIALSEGKLYFLYYGEIFKIFSLHFAI